MRFRIFVAFFVAVVAAPVFAQENYTVPAQAADVTDLSQVIIVRNEKLCIRLNAGTNGVCTQAQACTAANAAGGASCTAAQARAANARVFIGTTQAGREEYVIFAIVVPAFADQKAAVPGWERKRLCDFWATANTTQKNQICTDFGRAAGCQVCS